MYTCNGVLLSLQKERTPIICKNINETRRYCGKWYKPDTGRQIPNDITYIMNKRVKIIEAESRLVIASWQFQLPIGNGKVLAKEYKVAVTWDEKVLEIYWTA